MDVIQADPISFNTNEFVRYTSNREYLIHSLLDKIRPYLIKDLDLVDDIQVYYYYNQLLDVIDGEKCTLGASTISKKGIVRIFVPAILWAYREQPAFVFIYEIINTIAHEFRHIYQYRNNTFDLDTLCLNNNYDQYISEYNSLDFENDANAYASDFVNRHQSIISNILFEVFGSIIVIPQIFNSCDYICRSLLQDQDLINNICSVYNVKAINIQSDLNDESFYIKDDIMYFKFDMKSIDKLFMNISVDECIIRFIGYIECALSDCNKDIDYKILEQDLYRACWVYLTNTII